MTLGYNATSITESFNLENTLTDFPIQLPTSQSFVTKSRFMSDGSDPMEFHAR
jgi:hypothetical protein